MTEAPVVLDVSLHKAQMEVWNSPARFKVVACGRRFGKTFLAVNMLIEAAGRKPGSINWWVAPLYDQTDVAFRFFTEALPAELVKTNRTKKSAVLWNGSIVAFKTASDPDALRSEGLDFVALDEAAFQKADVWPSALRPALADKKGRAVLIGTFDGENWFYDLYRRGQSEEREEWESWRFPSSANPFLDPEEIEEARRTTPHAEFQQEYMANPLVYKGAVFSGDLLETARKPAVYDAELPTYAGLDWGYTNPTALEICQEHPTTGEIRWVHETLWHSVELNQRCQAIADVCERLKVRIVFSDAAGKDENITLAAHFVARGMNVVIKPVAFNKFKAVAISTRRWYLENGMEALGDVPQLVADSKRYRYKQEQEEVEKVDDHTVDAATCFYSARRSVLRREAA